MKSASAPCYPLYMEADAPEQKTVEAQQIDTGVKNEGEDGYFAMGTQVTSRGQEAIVKKHEDFDEQQKALAEAGYTSNYFVKILKLEEGNKLNITVQGVSTCTPLYRFQLRLDGKVVPLFDGNYYGDARLANTNMKKSGTLISLDFDLTDYPGARTAQLLMIPLPEKGYTYEESRKRHCEIHATRVAWIRYDGDEIE